MTALIVVTASVAALTLASAIVIRRRQLELKRLRVYETPSNFSYD